MKQRAKITAETWWSNAASTFEVIKEFLVRAQKGELREKGHECGHRFEIRVRSSLHSSGPGEHSDANYWDANVPVTVRAHNLRDALLLAAALPLGEWFPAEDEDEGPDTTGHWQFTDHSGTWCLNDCPMPDEECGALAVEQNAGR